MKSVLLYAGLLFSAVVSSQHVVSGRVTDAKGSPVPGTNVFIEGSYDGATSAADGSFSFETTEEGKQNLIVSSLGFDNFSLEIDVASAQNLVVKLKKADNVLDAVTVTAGTFEAGDKSRVSVLKPLDIVTTAGSAGNIIAALQTLPGTQTVGEDGRLFVRGGEADETQTFVDGIRVAQPYGASTNELPTRGRFSPFLFSGISFSTGGYSAEYGEALSSVLLLNTQDEETQNKTDISLMTVGLGAGHTIKKERNSISLNVAYIDLAPYQVVIPQNVEWNRPFQSLSGEAVYRQDFETGLLKVYASFDASRFDIDQKSINEPFLTRVNLHNNNFYLNTNYKGDIFGNWQLFTGVGYGYSKNDIDLNLDDVNGEENAAHLKLKLKKKLSSTVKLSFGADHFITKYDESFSGFEGDSFNSGYESNITALYTEADFTINSHFAAKAGVRFSSNSLLNETSVVPRVSLAYRVSKFSQFSLAYGEFTQSPRRDYLKWIGDKLDSERASHYILNYQYMKDKRTFRAEAFYKSYDDLVRYNDATDFSSYRNSGYGYATGLDIFWRDGATIKFLEYWLSYSFIDTKRLYRDFPEKATPSFVSDQNISLVTKYWINSLRSQVGFTHTFATGRPFDNPNESRFMGGKTKAYNNFSFNWAYLLDQQKILYFSMSNVFGNANVFGYEYSNAPGDNGRFARREIIPTADRFFFIGFFWTISEDKKSNQLKNL